MGNNMEMIKEFKEAMMNKYEMIDLGLISLGNPKFEPMEKYSLPK
jgi:hypothetical protein